MSIIEKLKSTIEKLNTAQNIDDLNAITLFDSDIEKKKKKYPDLNFEFSQKEIEEFSESDLVDNQYNIDGNKIDNNNTLAKILYAYIWKQGGHEKIHHIIEGLNNVELENKRSAFVFTQFGRSLRNINEPIIDQHVIRAFKFYKTEYKDFKFNSIKKGQLDLVDEYKEWLRKKTEQINGNPMEIISKIDDILFCIGRELKKEQ